MVCAKHGNFVIIFIIIHLTGLKSSFSKGQCSDYVVACAKC